MPKKTTKEAVLKKPRYLGKPLPTHVAGKQPSGEQQVRRDLDKEYLVRALSHDVGAHLMILEYSFRQYNELAKQLASTQATESQTPPPKEVASNGIGEGFRATDEQAVFWQDLPKTEIAPHWNGQLSQTADTKGDPKELPRKMWRLQSPTSPQQATSLQQTLPSDKLTEAACHVTACIDEMKRFVDELISFAKTGNIDMEPTSVSVADLVAEVLFEQRGLLEKRDIKTVVSSPLPTVFANATRVKQVLTNLIRNAAIHGCDDISPMIIVAAEMVQSRGFSGKNGHFPDENRREMTAFCVRDNGHGIPQTECGHIFEPGYRVPGNQNEGSGTGLAIVKKIATYYGGNVSCESRPNSTDFIVTLPHG